MQEKTQAEYRSLAEHFYATKLRGQPPSPKRVADALAACSADYRPASWRRLRCAIAYDQEAKGYGDAAERIRAVENLARKQGLPMKPKQRRATEINAKDEKKLLDHLGMSGDVEVAAAVVMAKYLGVRPAEMMDVRIRNGMVEIRGAKKSHEGARGADRVVDVHPDVLQIIATCIGHLQSSPRGLVGVQDRLRRICSGLWPQRKALPTLYTFRHQLGSDLKAHGVDRVEIAYLMGHQATKSVDQYGDKRRGRTKPLLRPAPGADLSQVRVNHIESRTLKAPQLEPPAPAPDDFDFGF